MADPAIQGKPVFFDRPCEVVFDQATDSSGVVDRHQSTGKALAFADLPNTSGSEWSMVSGGDQSPPRGLAAILKWVGSLFGIIDLPNMFRVVETRKTTTSARQDLENGKSISIDASLKIYDAATCGSDNHCDKGVLFATIGGPIKLNPISNPAAKKGVSSAPKSLNYCRLDWAVTAPDIVYPALKAIKDKGEAAGWTEASALSQTEDSFRDTVVETSEAEIEWLKMRVAATPTTSTTTTTTSSTTSTTSAEASE